MLWLLIVTSVLVLLIAPLRQGFFAHWRFTIPAAGALVGGLVLTAFLVSFGVPAWAMLILPPLLALHIGAAGKAWLDQNLGPRTDRGGQESGRGM
jgi:hypothetical protein